MHLELNKVGPNELVKLNFSYFLYPFRIDVHLIQIKKNIIHLHKDLSDDPNTET